MKQFFARCVAASVWAAAMAMVLCVAGVGTASGDDLLVIYSPHSEAIRDEFTQGFADHYRKATGRSIELRWPDSGGSSMILPQLRGKYAAGIHDVDLVFGGGPIHSQLKNYGLLEPYKLPPEMLQALPRTIAGEPLYDPEFHWYGAAVSSFGLICNKGLIADRKLPEVTEWKDMARPEFFGLVGVVDASQSGSVRKAYDIVLQAYGYERGMEVLMLMAANARGIGRSSRDIPKDCAQGLIALGPCIDFNAMVQLLSPGGEQLGFVLPKGLTVVNTDPISILRDAPHREAAERFVRFVMGREGQMLWSLNKGAAGGPQKQTLGRYCVLPKIYTERKDDLAHGLANPFDSPPNAFYDQQKENARIEILPAYLKAMMVTNKRLLTQAWSAVIASGRPKDLVEELTQPLIGEDEMLRLASEVWVPPSDEKMSEKDRRREIDRRKRLRSDTLLAWSEGFRNRYKTIIEKAGRRKGK